MVESRKADGVVAFISSYTKNGTRSYPFCFVEKIRRFGCATKSTDNKKYPCCGKQVGRQVACIAKKYSGSLYFITGTGIRIVSGQKGIRNKISMPAAWIHIKRENTGVYKTDRSAVACK